MTSDWPSSDANLSPSTFLFPAHSVQDVTEVLAWAALAHPTSTAIVFLKLAVSSTALLLPQRTYYPAQLPHLCWVCLRRSITSIERSPCRHMPCLSPGGAPVDRPHANGTDHSP